MMPMEAPPRGWVKRKVLPPTSKHRCTSSLMVSVTPGNWWQIDWRSSMVIFNVDIKLTISAQISINCLVTVFYENKNCKYYNIASFHTPAYICAIVHFEQY